MIFDILKKKNYYYDLLVLRLKLRFKSIFILKKYQIIFFSNFLYLKKKHEKYFDIFLKN